MAGPGIATTEGNMNTRLRSCSGISRCLACDRYGIGPRCGFCGLPFGLHDSRPAVSELGAAAWITLVGSVYVPACYLTDSLAVAACGVASVLYCAWFVRTRCRVET